MQTFLWYIRYLCISAGVLMVSALFTFFYSVGNAQAAPKWGVPSVKASVHTRCRGARAKTSICKFLSLSLAKNKNSKGNYIAGITSLSNGTLLPGVTIQATLGKRKISTSSNENGLFLLSGLIRGSYLLSTSSSPGLKVVKSTTRTKALPSINFVANFTFESLTTPPVATPSPTATLVPSPTVSISMPSPTPEAAPIEICGDNLDNDLNGLTDCQDSQCQTIGTTYYASQEGGGSGTAQNSPFKISDFWEVAQPGDILELMDGTYTGPDSMIQPPSGLSGIECSPIIVRALHDGAVSIDGQGIYQPVRLDLSNYFVLEGFNAHSSGYHVIGLSYSNFNILRRLVAWDADDANTAVMQIYHSLYNLVEDCALFGRGRKTLSLSYGGDDTIIRRLWARFEGSTVIGPKQAIAIAYNNYRTLMENSIATWDAVLVPETYELLDFTHTPCWQVAYYRDNYSQCANQAAATFTNHSLDQPFGIYAVDHMDEDKRTYSQLLGSVAYTKSGQRADTGARGIFVTKIAQFSIRDSFFISKDNLDPVDLSTPRNWGARLSYPLTGGNSAVIPSATKVNGHYYQAVVAGVRGSTEPIWPTDGSDIQDGSITWRDMGPLGLNFSDSTMIGSGTNTIYGWQTQNNRSGSTLANAYGSQSAYTASSGANLCYRYVNGQRTDQPLWPWPMNQRIKDAISQANQITPQYNREVTDVTQTISQLLGAIPPECCDESRGVCS